jgi:DNA (cytosine-5)-methyltransferase 1
VADGATPEDAVAAVSDAALSKSSMLSLEPMLVIARHRPTWVVLEQVPGVLPLWEVYAQIMPRWGYSVKTAILHSEQFGVPQTRKRAFLVAHLEREAVLPTPTHSKYHSHNPAKLDDGVKPWVSMEQALGVTATMRSNYGTGGDPKARGERPAPAPAPAVTSKIGRNKWVPPTPNGGDASWVERRPSPTIVGSYRPDIVAVPKYRKAGDGPRQNQPGSVSVSVSEAAILQSFPPDYVFTGNQGQQYLQVGNSVPPLLQAAVVRALLGLTAPVRSS